MKKKLLALLILCLFNSFFWTACTTPPKQHALIYFNDFEFIKGWAPAPNLVKFPKPHSGIFSYKLDSLNVYGLGFKLSFREISEEPVKKVKFKVWAYIKSKAAEAKLVIDISTPDKQNVFWQAKHIHEVVKDTGKWYELVGEFSLPNTFNKPENIISIYPWNIAKEDVLIDDMEIEFVL